MSFQKGNPGSPGRPKGSRNKKTVIVEIIAAKYNQHPFEILMNFATGDWKALGYDSEVYILENAQGGTKIGYTISPEMRLSATKEALLYMVPKRKEELEDPDDERAVMSIEQKKELYEQGQKELEKLKIEIAAIESNQIEASD